ncbi:MAG TPA: two-component system activity regulator YycH [Bacillota bacterium]|nr:two-component system activity regulator YycH [Bacillota bacterium]
MKIETTKTIILIVLVGLSLFLTFHLWNYKPNSERQQSESTYVSEVDLGGEELTKRKVIQPESVLFHRQDGVFGFSEANRWRNFYRQLDEWTLDDYSIHSAEATSFDSNYVEIKFATSIPAEAIKSLFSLNEEDLSLPQWNFEKVYIVLDDGDSSVQAYFPSESKKEYMMFTVHDSSAYKDLQAYMAEHDELVEYIALSAKEPIYIPADHVEMKRRSLSVRTIEPTHLVNALFRNPSLVSPNVGEAYFTDGQRGMRVKHEGKSMEFINPIVPSEEPIDYLELLELALEDINEHRGWTDNYALAEINEVNNSVSFQMEYDDYPVHSNGNITRMEQIWHDNQLHQYVRPLFRLNNTLGVESVELPSGEEVIQYLQSSSTYNEEDIRDIHIGYRLTYLEGTTFSVTLDPVWYINYKGVWQEIRPDDIRTSIEEGE